MINKILVIVILGTLLYTSKMYEYEDYQNSIHFIENKMLIRTILFDYIKNLSDKEIKLKTNFKITNLNKNNVSAFYVENTQKFTKNEKEILTSCINDIQKYIKKDSLLNNYSWKFVKFTDGIEFEFPFTFKDVIFLNRRFLKMIKKKRLLCLEILIHEKIHIIQRYNQSLFDKFYVNHLEIEINKNIIINNSIKKMIFSNPDGLDLIYIYKDIHNNKYLPLLVYLNKNLEKILIPLQKYNTGYKTKQTYLPIEDVSIKLFKYYPKDISLYHPNEVTACIIPKLIMGKENISTKIKLIFKNIMEYI
jgi:hypothetical protein